MNASMYAVTGYCRYISRMVRLVINAYVMVVYILDGSAGCLKKRQSVKALILLSVIRKVKDGRLENVTEFESARKRCS